jgi:hypothetical protein
MSSMEDPTDRHHVAGALLDERSAPNLRHRFGALATRSESLAVAIRRIRLMGVDLTEAEVKGLRRMRVLLGDMDAGTFVAEADAVMMDPERRVVGERLMWLLQSGVLHVRVAPLMSWAPDFSVFHDSDGPSNAIFGCHWFQRPYPHPGPAFATFCGRAGASLGAVRFEELWISGHDVTPAVERMLGVARSRAGAASIQD